MERPLLRLPRLSGRDAFCHLPLSETSAAALFSALLEDDPAARGRRFEAILRADPALTVWCSLHPNRKSAPRDIHELANWLDASALIVLRWTSDDLVSVAEDTSRSSDRWDIWVAKSLALAEAAESMAPEVAGRVRLLAFLSHAYEWLVSCATPRHADVLEQFAPPWLRRLTAELRDSSVSDDPALQAVKRASRVLPESQWDAGSQKKAPSQPSDSWTAEALPRLTSQLARLAELEDRFRSTLRREKLASLQKLAYGASHEVNNPLANIATRAQTLLQSERDPERQRALATINDQAFRAFEMIANMMLFAKPPELNLAPTDLGELVNRGVEEMEPAAQQQGTSLTARRDGEPPVIRGDATQLAVLLRALLRNALEAVECGGEIEVSVRRLDEDRVELAVRDTGPGLSDEAQRHLFDPFYSSREAGRGLGFGLSWCWTIVELHRGEVAFESIPGKGTTFLITLPVEGPRGDQPSSGPGAIVDAASF